MAARDTRCLRSIVSLSPKAQEGYPEADEVSTVCAPLAPRPRDPEGQPTWVIQRRAGQSFEGHPASQPQPVLGSPFLPQDLQLFRRNRTRPDCFRQFLRLSGCYVPSISYGYSESYMLGKRREMGRFKATWRTILRAPGTVCSHLG